ncbi:MAG: lasso peptide isopeptide bond-forming cyclase [Thermosynechococcaceae cyanobacterium MS004]|nr:lasso peptide isopeptide bond-forming cyclase [Thermosynechococcaceae cyanobacterium MS004]
MSGILGLLYQDGRPVGEAQLSVMLEAIAHRGPDGQGLWCEGSVGLGHQMLWTTPESLQEKLPHWDAALQYAITADVRLDNRAELIDRLGLQQYSGDRLTDSDILLAAYRQWGAACPEHLLGDFAFALWDAPNQTLFCARDHFGVKPFYFYTQSQAFAFATEIKAILALEEVSPQLNETRIADCLAANVNDRRITIYQNIWRLPPAHALTLRLGEAPQEYQYWQLDPTREIHRASDADYAEEYREIFLSAVQCRMRSAYPVGAHLSGGLDSSSVACSARYLSLKHQQAPIHTFSHTYPDVPASDESEFIHKVLAQGHFTHHDIRGDVLGALTEWESLFGAVDEPLIGNAYFNWIVNRSAQENGVRVLMSGFDGDTVVGHGLNLLTESAQALQWQLLIQEATLFVQRYERAGTTVSGLVRLHSFPTLKKLGRARRWVSLAQAIDQLSPIVQFSRKRLWYEFGLKELDGLRQLRQLRKKRRQRRSPTPNPFPYFNPSFLARLNYPQRQQEFEPNLPPPQSEREFQWRTLTSGTMVLPLEIVGPMSAVHGVETTHPFLDKRLVEYCLALPASQKLSQGWSRMILRRGMDGILPPDIQWRGSKGSATAVFFHGLQKYDRPLLDEIADQDFNRLEGYLNLDHAREQYRILMNNSGENIGALWFVITLALWLRLKKC